VVAQALSEKATEIRMAVHLLADMAAAGDRQSALALLPWIDQAYGKPTERVEHKYPASIDELEQMSEEELERLVAQGRRQRVQGLSGCARRVGLASP
jgi:hypothetical protein